ncbi:MAG: hypothetical protein HWE27_06830 [Gammaproteobacteria bacterium]|nr:hypothetical protein [Gammaproteobacteria bacterium]
MDKIEIKEYKSKYFDEEYSMIFINGSSLDLILDSNYPEENLYGLVPSATWLWDESEKSLSIERLMNDLEASTFVPMLVCPDDADFSCTVLIIEVEIKGQRVNWKRMGIDVGEFNKGVGVTVRWLEPNISFTFEKSKYDDFREKLILLSNEL